MRTHPVDKLLEQHCYKSAAGLLQLVRFYMCIPRLRSTYDQWPVDGAHFLIQTADEVEPKRHDQDPGHNNHEEEKLQVVCLRRATSHFFKEISY